MAQGNKGIEFTTPVGRIVWGHPCKPRNKTNNNNQVELDANGKPIQQWAFGIAIPKAEFQQGVWPYMAQEAAKGYPQGIPPQFSWKYIDGDGVDRQGQPYAKREGYAGCYILSISTELNAPPIFKFNGTGYDQLPPEAIKTGDYVSCGLNLVVNVPANVSHTPGLYVNPRAVEFVGYGTEIQGQGGADPNALFGGKQHQLPPGASATPIGAQGQPGMPGMTGQGGMPGQMPMGAPPAMQQPYAPPMAPAPAQQPMQPPMAPAPAQQPMQPGYPAQQPYAPPMAPAPAQMPPPAPDFIPGYQQPVQPQQPGYPPQQQPAPGYPVQPGYPAQPGMMPGR